MDKFCNRCFCKLRRFEIVFINENYYILTNGMCSDCFYDTLDC